MLNLLSGVPFAGGFFSAIAGRWAEVEEASVNAALKKHTDDQIAELNGVLVSMSNSRHVIVASVSFDPRTGKVFELSGVTSFGDLGHLDFIVALANDTRRYLLMPYGSGPVALKSVEQHAGAVRLRFEEPAPDRVTIVFIEQ